MHDALLCEFSLSLSLSSQLPHPSPPPQIIAVIVAIVAAATISTRPDDPRLLSTILGRPMYHRYMQVRVQVIHSPHGPIVVIPPNGTE